MAAARYVYLLYEDYDEAETLVATTSSFGKAATNAAALHVDHPKSRSRYSSGWLAVCGAWQPGEPDGNGSVRCLGKAEIDGRMEECSVRIDRRPLD